MIKLDTMDKGKRQIQLNPTTKRIGGGHVVVGVSPKREPQPVDLDSHPVQPEVDAMDKAANLRAQAAELIRQATQLENASRNTGADGRTRPTWDRFNNDRTEQQVRQLREAGQSVRAISEVLGCSRGTAHRIIRKLGL
ncbi:helix-turn-helix domain-containing protein [Mycobacterium sp. Dal123C01]|uniref:helix-turn-helix domain-containing protein n=1 Tax=Mycobacterium sp. Dal123C01 TaxID=3457577 RepID=UPI00403ED667